jgi:hypothetical protein
MVGLKDASSGGSCEMPIGERYALYRLQEKAKVKIYGDEGLFLSSILDLN